MKFLVALLFLAGVVQGMDVPINQDSEVVVPHQYRHLQATNGTLALPTQTFFVPLPEESLHNNLLRKLNIEVANPPVAAILAITISTDYTVIWYDQWEDGYDADVTQNRSVTTKVWGDGNSTNGCPPNVVTCTNANDKLMAGTAINVKSNVVIPRNKTQYYYDGGDRIQASFPITVTKAGHPQLTAVLAGAIQLLDTSQWGASYEAPVGVDFGVNFTAFEWSIIMFQAGTDNTHIVLPNSTTITLNMGQSSFYVVNQGNMITSNKPIQVILLTGDIDLATSSSKPETRWYVLRPTTNYAKSFISPVGDTVGKSKLIVYNPNAYNMSYTMKYLVNQTLITFTQQIMSKKAVYSPVVPRDSGALVESTQNFVALTITDSEEYDSNNVRSYGATYDWGFTAVPTTQLSTEVLVGLGWGCLDNTCGTTIARTIVWVTPVENATIYVDFQNNGVRVSNYTVNALASIRVSDLVDKDMSGASIYATKPGTGKNGQPVDIAVAWGQDPVLANAAPDWQKSMDMGTVVLPLSIVHVAAVVNKPIVQAGEELEYTIRVLNCGQKYVFPNNLTLIDALDPEVVYIPGSTVMVTKAGVVSAVPDSTTGTPFPFDNTGYTIPIALPQRGAYIDFVFKVNVTTNLSSTKETILNNGILQKHYDGTEGIFDKNTTIDYSPSIQVDNKVARGVDGSMCSNSSEVVEARNGTNVVYCFNITNMGNSYLTNIVVDDEEIMYSNNSIPILAPGASTMIAVVSSINANLTNQVSVTATPSLLDGTIIYGENDVTATDQSSVIMKAGLSGNVRSGYAPPTNSTTCLQDNWNITGHSTDLVCASSEIHVAALSANESAICMPGEPITLNVDATIHFAGSRRDVGWYIAQDGGDALVGECIVNGLQDNGVEYNLMDIDTGLSTVGSVTWTTGPNTDECGDVVIANATGIAKMNIPILVDATILCADENDDGNLDFAICFDWKAPSAGNSACSIAGSIPDTNVGCFCTRVDVPNVDVVTQAIDIVLPC